MLISFRLETDSPRGSSATNSLASYNLASEHYRDVVATVSSFSAKRLTYKAAASTIQGAFLNKPSFNRVLVSVFYQCRLSNVCKRCRSYQLALGARSFGFIKYYIKHAFKYRKERHLR